MTSTQRNGGPSRDALAIASVILSLISLVGVAVGIGFAVRALDEAESGSDVQATGGTGASASAVTVELSEFKLDPATISVATGGTITVVNKGTVQHDFAIDGEDLKTPLINPGGSAELDLGDLAPGSYDVMCTVAGHSDAGMHGQLVVGAGGGTAAAPTTTAEMSADEMDKSAHDRTALFPAKTDGDGTTKIEPTILPDGTKEFRLTAEVVQWEVEPGRTVEAWGYNGVVPGPEIRVSNGDRLRIILKNELPESTVIHWHGIDVPNDQDGVPDITQPPIKPGAEYTYEFTAIGPAIGMYHAHADSQKQVPKGLFAPFIVDPIPIPANSNVTAQYNWVLNDAGDLGFTINGKAFPATEPIIGKVGETFLLNYYNEGLQIHPMHLHGPSQLIVAKDGHALPQPYLVDTVLVAPGERYTVLVTPNRPGTWAWHCHILTHAEAPEGFIGMTSALVVQ